MTDKDSNFREHAGYVIFPRNLADLTDTNLCPACHDPLTSTVCTNCELDLNHASAADLHATSVQAAVLLDRRFELIGKIRFETAAAIAERAAALDAERVAAEEAARAEAASQAAAQALAAEQAEAAARAQFAHAMASAPVVAAPRVSDAPPQPAPARSAPRRSSIQVLLLIVGISLLSVAAVFFLIYAFINYGLVWRSAIIGAITVATFVTASVLRKRNYAGTAEGIAVFAVVLVYLDAFAMKANDLFGLGSADGLTYWGATLIISSVGFVLWHRLSALRVPSIAGFAVFAPGLGLLVAGLTGPLDSTTRTWAALAAVGLAGLVHPLAVTKGSQDTPAVTQVPERVTALSIASVGLFGAFVLSFFIAPDYFWAPAIALGAVALIALAHVAVILLTEAKGELIAAFTVGVAGFGGIAASAALASPITRDPSTAYWVIAPIAGAAFIAASLDVLLHRVLGAPAVPAARAARLGALIVTGLALVAPASIALLLSGEVVVTGLITKNWALLPNDFVKVVDEQEVSAIIALGIFALLAVAASAGAGLFRMRLKALRWVLLLGALLAIPLLGVLWAVVAAWFALSCAALALLVRFAQRGELAESSRTQRAPLAVIAIAGGVFGYLTGWGSTNVWHFAAITAITLLLVSRLAVRQGRTVLLAVAILVVFVGATAAGSYFDLGRTTDISVVTLDALRLLGIAATLTTAAAALPRIPLLSTADRRTMFWFGTPLALGIGIVTWTMLLSLRLQLTELLLPEYVTSVAVSFALLVALVLWSTLRENYSLFGERAVASASLAVVAFWLVDSSIRAFGLADVASGVAALIAVLIVSAGALLASALGRPLGNSAARDLGITLVALPALFDAAVKVTDTTWLVFIMAGVAALLLSISNDGLFGSQSPRKHLGWLALALATAGLWWRLWGAEVAALDAYVLPLAGALLLIALFIWRAARSGPDPEASRTAPLIALGGLLVAVLPLSLNALTGEPTRVLILFAASAAALLFGSFVRGTQKLRPYLDALAAAGAVGTIVLMVGRATFLRQSAHGIDNYQMDGWLAAGLLVILAAAVGQGLARGIERSSLRRLASEALCLIAISAVVILETSGFASDQYGTARAWATLVLFCLLHLTSVLLWRAPFTSALGWASLGFAVVAALGALFTAALGPFEIAIVATVLAAIAAVPQIRFAAQDRELLFWVGIPVALLTGIAGWGTGLVEAGTTPDRILSVVATSTLVLTLLFWAIVQKDTALRIERIAAAIAIAPSFYLLVDSVSRLIQLPELAVQIAPVSSALIVAAGALAVTLLWPTTVPRWAREIGIAIVAIPATVTAIQADSQSTWLVLVLAAVTALLLAIEPDGLFRSASPRKHLGWLALALATAGLWWRLASSEITAIESYVLPLAGGLLLIALLVWNARRKTSHAAGSAAAPLVALGGLLVAIIPIALNAATGQLERAIAIGLGSAALALLGSLVRGTPRQRPYLDVAALAGVLGVLVLAIGRSYAIITEPGNPDARLDVWLGGAFLVLVIAAFGQSVPRSGESGSLRLGTSQGLGFAGLTIVLIFEVLSLGSDTVGQIRALAIVLLFSAAHVIAVAVNRVPLGRTLGWVAFGYAAIVAVVGTANGALDPIEIAAVPLALALFATGVIHLDRTPAARSWPTLGPGLLLLLTPSLVHTFWDAPLWRLVAIGVVAVAAIVIGLVRKLQAPFIIGVVVALVHGFRTFEPLLQNAYRSTEWWVWAGVGGLLLVVLAARYEKSVRTLRTTITKIGELR